MSERAIRVTAACVRVFSHTREGEAVRGVFGADKEDVIENLVRYCYVAHFL